MCGKPREQFRDSALHWILRWFLAQHAIMLPMRDTHSVNPWKVPQRQSKDPSPNLAPRSRCFHLETWWSLTRPWKLLCTVAGLGRRLSERPRLGNDRIAYRKSARNQASLVPISVRAGNERDLTRHHTIPRGTAVAEQARRKTQARRDSMSRSLLRTQGSRQDRTRGRVSGRAPSVSVACP